MTAPPAGEEPAPPLLRRLHAVLDTSVLASQARHWLWAAAFDGYYAGYWSTFIVGELVRVRMRSAIAHGVPYEVYRQRLNDLVHTWSDVLLVSDYRRVPASGRLVDPDDEPILAAARAVGATIVVSLNTRDFPAGGVIDGVRFLTPADFWLEIARRYPGADQVLLMARRRIP